jgi:site-specific DNA-methyltransferase (adenine-specific)
MKGIPDKSVDMILADLPYGTTACKWDVVIPFEPLWEQYKRIIKDRGAIVLFGNQPFTTLLIASNLSGFKYCWQWDKKIPAGMSYARFRPMQQTEDIAVFTSDGGPSVYFPQMIKRDKPIKSGGTKKSESAPIAYKDPDFKKTYEEKQPVTLIQFDKIRRGSLHPTQKPVALFEYLIKTYTNEGETVLDNCMGSGTTGIACKNLNRNFIGIELDPLYFKIAEKRINENL